MFQEKCKFASLSTMLAIILIFFVSGCATTKPTTFNEQTRAFFLAQESVAFMTLKVSNQYKPSYQPSVDSMTVWKDNGAKFRTPVNKPYNQVENQFNEYLTTMSLPAGFYKIGRIYGFSGKALISGTFHIPVFSDFELKQSKVVYLGHIEATVREKKNDDELRAGPPIPVIDQRVTGFSGGTFDIKISDNFDGDVAIFKQKYPFLGNSSVEKTILPPWKKPTAEVLYQYRSLRSEIDMPSTPQMQIPVGTVPHKAVDVTSKPHVIEKPQGYISEEKWGAPVWNIGDTWKFSQEDKKSWGIKVIQTEDSFYIIADSTTSDLCAYDKNSLSLEFYIDRSGKRTKPSDSFITYPTAAIVYLDFPLLFGKKWKRTVTLTPARGLSLKTNFLEEFECISLEKVTVPAGTFEAMKIKLKSTIMSRMTSGVAYIWYSPELKGPIKMIFEKSSHWSSDRQNYELISFNLKEKQPPPPEVKSQSREVDTSSKPQPSQPEKVQTIIPPTASPVTPSPAANTVAVTGTFANIRSGAGNEFSIVSTVKQGDKLILLGEYGEWFNVRLENGLEGWINNRFVK